MDLRLSAIPALQDNYIWCLERAGEALVVDPGDADVVMKWMSVHGLVLKTILVTHHHRDHVAGLAALRHHHQPVIYGPAENISGLDHIVADGERLELRPFGTADVIAVPGHTLGHVAYFLPAAGVVFCGDTLFSAGCGRLFEGSAAQMHHSLQRLAALPDATLVCCSHEYTSANLRFAAAVEPNNPARVAREEEVALLRTAGKPSLPVSLGAEKAYNPFLRCDVPAIVAAVSRHAGQTLAPGLATLAGLRAWKDNF